MKENGCKQCVMNRARNANNPLYQKWILATCFAKHDCREQNVARRRWGSATESTQGQTSPVWWILGLFSFCSAELQRFPVVYTHTRFCCIGCFFDYQEESVINCAKLPWSETKFGLLPRRPALTVPLVAPHEGLPCYPRLDETEFKNVEKQE